MGGGKAYLLFLAQSTHRLVQADTAMGNFDFEEFMQRPKTNQLNNIQQQQTPEFYCSILNRLFSYVTLTMFSMSLTSPGFISFSKADSLASPLIL